MPVPNTEASTRTVSAEPFPGRATSLNADGTKKWFIPPFVIPVVVIALVAIGAALRGS